jgi:uncharacterized protein (DUF433 family)
MAVPNPATLLALFSFPPFLAYNGDVDYRNVITIDPAKKGGHACVRNMRIAVSDVLGWLSCGMSIEQIVDDYPELSAGDVMACLAYAADRERRLISVST